MGSVQKKTVEPLLFVAEFVATFSCVVFDTVVVAPSVLY